MTAYSRLYCYGPQSPAVELFLHECGSNARLAHLTVIRAPQDVDGLNDFTIAVVPKHHRPIPREIWEALAKRRGVRILELTDAHRLYVEHRK